MHFVSKVMNFKKSCQISNQAGLSACCSAGLWHRAPAAAPLPAVPPDTESENLYTPSLLWQILRDIKNKRKENDKSYKQHKHLSCNHNLIFITITSHHNLNLITISQSQSQSQSHLITITITISSLNKTVNRSPAYKAQPNITS